MISQRCQSFFVLIDEECVLMLSHDSFHIIFAVLGVKPKYAGNEGPHSHHRSSFEQVRVFLHMRTSLSLRLSTAEPPSRVSAAPTWLVLGRQ